MFDFVADCHEFSDVREADALQKVADVRECSAEVFRSRALDSMRGVNGRVVKLTIGHKRQCQHGLFPSWDYRPKEPVLRPHSYRVKRLLEAGCGSKGSNDSSEPMAVLLRPEERVGDKQNATCKRYYRARTGVLRDLYSFVSEAFHATKFLILAASSVARWPSSEAATALACAVRASLA